MSRAVWRVGYVLRHVVAVLILPVTVVVVIPTWIVRASGVPPVLPRTAGQLAMVACGVLALTAGAMLFGSSLSNFFSQGEGTLAPWDPPRRLVVGGPYRYVRNPMISGVIFLLCGEALVMRSVPHAVWAAIFLMLNIVQIAAIEEPLLRRKFGVEYTRYCRNVHRFVPRLSPWTQHETKQDARTS